MSQQRTLTDEKAAATSFINSIIQTSRDQAAVATLTNTLNIEQQPTNDLSLVRSAIARAKIAEPTVYKGGRIVSRPVSPPAPAAVGSTAIWDALMLTCNSRFSSTSSAATRHAIVILSDGFDTSSRNNLDDAAQCLSLKKTAVFSIGIGDPRFDGINKNGLRKLSETTGGQAYFPKQTTDLAAAFDQIRSLLRNYYVLSYDSTSLKPADKVHLEGATANLKKVDLLYSRTVSR
jgi:VWFA-related protein